MQIQTYISNSEQMELFSLLRSPKTKVNRDFETIDYPFKSKVLVPFSEKINSEVIQGIPDDNRSVIIPNSSIIIDDREFKISIKGVGARHPLYGLKPLDYTLRTDFLSNPNDNLETSTSREISNENWFGESPYGAQGFENAISDLQISESFFNNLISNLHICPVIEINEIPPDYVKEREMLFWYRRFSKSFYQEKRLVPSNIRLFHQSNLTLGQAPDVVLSKFNISDNLALDDFITNYISSGLSILTIIAHTLISHQPSQFKALDFTDVWLDKDSVIAQDGTLFFVDLEGLDWTDIPDQQTLENKIIKQINRNYYEFMYCLDLLIKEKDKLLNKYTNQRQKRETIATFIDIATIGNPFLKTDIQKNHLNLIVKPNHGFEDISIRFLDLV